VSTITLPLPQTRTSAVPASGRFPIKRDPSGYALLNLACGTKTDYSWNNLDFSPYATLKRHPMMSPSIEVGLLNL
jgi:hypothetical protein